MSMREPRPRDVSELDLRLSEVFTITQTRYREAFTAQSERPDKVFLQGFVEEDLISVPTVAYCLESRYHQNSGGYSVPEYWNVHIPENTSPDLQISTFWIKKCIPIPGTGTYSYRLYRYDRENGSVQIGSSKDSKTTDGSDSIEEFDEGELDTTLVDDGSDLLKVTAAVMRSEMLLVEFHR